MNLKKTNENISRTFDEEGVAQDHINQIDFQATDEEGNVIGSAWAQPSRVHFELDFYEGFESAEQAAAKLRETLGIEE